MEPRNAEGHGKVDPARIGPFTSDFSDPPTQWEMRAFRDWANSFFGATAR
ncbi:MAG: hypothetical protein NTY01_17440 [Verrucomicrobia bacterium]|nr:hypothetical protein [Verrucomicrobiota bacterium]